MACPYMDECAGKGREVTEICYTEKTLINQIPPHQKCPRYLNYNWKNIAYYLFRK